MIVCYLLLNLVYYIKIYNLYFYYTLFNIVIGLHYWNVVTENFSLFSNDYLCYAPKKYPIFYIIGRCRLLLEFLNKSTNLTSGKTYQEKQIL